MKMESSPISMRRLQTSVMVATLLATVGVAAEYILLQRSYSGAPTLRIDDRSPEFKLPPLGSAGATIDESVTGAILARPLFLQGRGLIPLAPTEPVAPAPSPPEIAIRLMGVQIFDGTRLAILQLDNSETALRAVEGQPVGDWTLKRIYRDHVDLARGSSIRSVYLGDTKPRPDGDAPSE
jgi:hypothetical protein